MFSRDGWTALWSVALAMAVIAAGCSFGSEESGAVPDVQPSVELLPAPSSTAVGERPVATPTSVETEPPTNVTPTVVTTPSSLDCLSTRARVAQLLLPLLTQPELFGAQAFAADGELGGIGLLGAPDADIGEDLAELQLASFVPVLVASDEEGGSVQRLGPLLGPIPSAAMSAQSKTPDEVRNQWLEYGARINTLGVDVVFGPVLDVGSGPGIESRSFSSDPAVVAEYGRAVASGLLEAGVMPVFKHFPGHGRASADSHLELPTTPPLDELLATDLVPYTQLLAEPEFQQRAGVMVGHLAVPGLSDDVPTTLSPEAVNGLLRRDLGFGGLVFTDAMNMGAIINGFGRLEAIELAFFAGADIAILGSLADLTPTLDHLEMRASSDPTFQAIVDNRAARIMAAKGQETLCSGAQ